MASRLNNTEKDQSFLVFDFGGGTLDVSVVDCFDNVILLPAEILFPGSPHQTFERSSAPLRMGDQPLFRDVPHEDGAILIHADDARCQEPAECPCSRPETSF